MRNFFKLLEAMQSIAIIVMVAVIGFSMAGCVFEDPNGGGGEDPNNGGVSEKTVTYIAVDGQPSNYGYFFVGDIFDPTGLEVKVYYSNQEVETITSGFTGFTWEIDMSTRGQKVIKVKHNASGVTGTHVSSGTVIFVCPTEDWVQTDFYGTWKRNDITVTISADSVVIDGSNSSANGTYTISDWGTITKTDNDGRAPNSFAFKITSSSPNIYSSSVENLAVNRSPGVDTVSVKVGLTTIGGLIKQ